MNSEAALEWFKANATQFSGALNWDEPLSKHTYYRIGGPARLLAIPKSREDLEWLSRGIQATGIPYFVLGLGSNLLVSDQGFPGVVIKAGRINLEIEAQGETLRTGASVAVSSLLRRATQDGWGGLEFMTGIPGSIGGVIAMNGGTHLGEAKDRVKRVEVFSLLDGKTSNFEGARLKFEYRKNLFLPKGAIVWAAEWKIEPQDPAAVKALIDGTLARRKASQPIDLPSCGSVFKNPREHGMHAWQVVEKVGLRGHQIGGAQFSEKHSNFIVNRGGALAADVRGLIELAKARAKDQLGISLEEEVKYLGAF